MSDIRKLIDTINEMATTSGSVASVAQPMGGVKSRKKDSIFYEGEKCTSCGCEPCKCDSSEGNAVDGTKTPDAPKVSEFGLWKNSALIGQEQRDKKKSKKTVSEGEDLAWDDPDLVKARKLIAAKKKDGHTEFKGIDKAISKSKDKNTRKHPTNEPTKVKENKASPYLGDREYNALDAVQDKIAKMAHRHKNDEWSLEDSEKLGKRLAARGRSHAEKLDELGNSLMPGGQRKLRLAQETFVDPRNSRRHPGAVDVAEEHNGEYDDEAGMAYSSLHTLSRAAEELLDTIESDDNLPEWVQEKISNAEMMLSDVRDYLQSEREQGIEPKQEGANRQHDSIVDENIVDTAKDAVKGVKRFMKGKPTVGQSIDDHESTARGAENKREVFSVTGNSKLSSDMSQQANREHEKAARIKNKFAAESTTKRTKK